MIEMTLKLALIGMEAIQAKSEELRVPIVRVAIHKNEPTRTTI